MAFKLGRRILCQFPVGNPADTASPFKPFISEPAGRPAVSGIGDQKRLVAVGCNPGLIACLFDGSNAMQDSFSRRPQFYFVDESKKLDPFSVISPCRGLTFFFAGSFPIRFHHLFC